jgi:hypothetical protein
MRLADELGEGGKDVEYESATGRGGVEVLVQTGEPDAAAAQVAHGSDEVLQRAGQP